MTFMRFSHRIPWEINIYDINSRELMETIPANVPLKGERLRKLIAVSPVAWQLQPTDKSDTAWRIAKSAEAYIKSKVMEDTLAVMSTLQED